MDFIRFYEVEITSGKDSELHNIITQAPENGEEAIKVEIENIKSRTNAGNRITGEVSVVMSGRVCVSVCVSVGATNVCVNVTQINVINVACRRLYMVT